MLLMLKTIREQTGTTPGDSVEVELWKDEEPRTVEVPAALREAMRKKGVLPFFDRLSYTHQKEYCRWIAEAKTEATRLQRAARAVEMLKKKIKTPDQASARGASRMGKTLARA
jgi:uncharacterized protein YdeI (YjbR/CyaY-like superfamily)